ncbi:hypothetical protein [Polaromonas sp.]|uniref:hypothetical protein n=1 Tax=Polaromonas sp. TaxID=1869339 RepID=UPI003CB993A8
MAVENPAQGVHSVYIVEPVSQGWIIERLMSDIARELNRRGIATRIGAGEGYAAEDVIFNSRYLVPLADAGAKINSLFITHVDDAIKEMELKARLKDFNSFVCLSPQDADFVTALKGNRTGVKGIELPSRDSTVRPVRVAMFSACYEDGRKNEEWIAEYFKDKSCEQKQSFVFCFMGWDWEKFCMSLARLDMNYEIYRYSRSMAGEYALNKEILATMDALIYLGFDGGAMSVYDGINAGIDVIASNISYHQGLDDSVILFSDRQGFFRELDRLYAKNTGRKNSLQQRSVITYVDHLLKHWNDLLMPSPAVAAERLQVPSADETKTLKLFRAHYKNLSLSRLRSAAIRFLQVMFSR